MLFHLISKLHEQTVILVTTKLAFGGWPDIFCDAKMATPHCDITGSGVDKFTRYSAPNDFSSLILVRATLFVFIYGLPLRFRMRRFSAITSLA